MSSEISFRREIVYDDESKSQVFIEDASSPGEALDRELKWVTKIKERTPIIIMIQE